MSCHGGADQASVESASIILVGNHNVGKSLIFGWLTGRYVTVANYPGTTVEITRGVTRLDGHRGVIDTPGVTSLEPISEDERVTLIWTGVVGAVLLVIGWLAAKVIPGSTSDFILELPPIRVPAISHLAIKTLARMEWYLREVLPLFILGTMVLFALDTLGTLNWMERAAEPLITNWLGLPPQATEAFLIGFLRRDYGAAGFFLMARQGLISQNQILVALVTITLFVPCIANFFAMVKERGVKTALAITAFIFPFAFAVGGILNIALRSL